MNDDRLSDLTVLAIERSFEIDFEKVKDAFANNHKNSRIILRWYRLLTSFYNKDVVAKGFLDNALWITSKLYIALQRIYQTNIGWQGRSPIGHSPVAKVKWIFANWRK
jgi:hypothetical protein